MSSAFRFSKAVVLDVQLGAAWYDRQSLTLGNRFRGEVKAALARLKTNPDLYARLHGNVRRVRVKKFPYSIYYSNERSTVLIGAIVRDGRDLQSILSRFPTP
jgi:toxin ParE1/3/4